MKTHAESARLLHDQAFNLVIGMDQAEKETAVVLLDNMAAVLALDPDEGVQVTARLLTALRGVVATAHHAARPTETTTTEKEAV